MVSERSKLDEILQMVGQDLLQVREAVRDIERDLGDPPVRDVFSYFFQQSGKLLRPMLVFLSAGTVRGSLDDPVSRRLVKLSTAIELIHSASLLHDDIIDGDLERRGQKTVNNVFGDGIATWAGDVLYTRAFAILAEEFPPEFYLRMLEVTGKMGIVEIRQAVRGDNSPPYEDYLELIQGKTALLMGISCRLGAVLAGADREQADALQEFGRRFGLIYQIVDDYIDKDPLGARSASPEEAMKHAGSAARALEIFSGSRYRHALSVLMDHVLNVRAPS